MKSHEIDFKIIGHDVQLVEVELDPGETVIAEAGAMLYMEDGIEFTARMGDGSNPNAGFFDKLLSAGSRLITGESLFLTHFTNQGWGKKHVAFAAPYPGTIIPINLSALGEKLLYSAMPFYVLQWARKSPSLLAGNWAPDFSAAKDLFCSNCRATAMRLFMPGAL